MEDLLKKAISSCPFIFRILKRESSIRLTVFAFIAIISFISFNTAYLITSIVYKKQITDSTLESLASQAQNIKAYMFDLMKRGVAKKDIRAFVENLNISERSIAFTAHIMSYNEFKDSNLSQENLQKISFGNKVVITDGNKIKEIYPLKAEVICISCHKEFNLNDTIGILTLQYDISPVVVNAEKKIALWFLALLPIPILLITTSVVLLNSKLSLALDNFKAKVDSINSVKDLTSLHVSSEDMGFTELTSISHQLNALSNRIKSVAVDKEILEFEIGILERFIITSDVVKDWKEHVSNLLVEINKVLQAHTLFSIFQIDEEVYDLEIFWYSNPSQSTIQKFEELVKEQINLKQRAFKWVNLKITHNLIFPHQPEKVISEKDIEFQTKSLILETPQIGGVVGIGVNAEVSQDNIRSLVIDSILTTLINVVGSIKAIYKYTRDLEYYATRDPLTNLYNQRIFWELLGYEISRAERHKYKFSLLVIDLDNFKNINDSYGHAFGDKYLREVSDTIHNALRQGDILGRYGGDEFAVVLPESDEEQGFIVATRIKDYIDLLTLDAPDGGRVKATASIGLAVYPNHASTAKDLFIFADSMMYRAKQQGKNAVLAPTAEDVVNIFKKTSEMTLMIIKAIEGKMVVPFFQPIAKLSTGQIKGYEVLSRIKHGEQVFHASDFIEIAEKVGMVNQLDHNLIDKVFHEMQEKSYEGMLFINLSTKSIIMGEFIAVVVKFAQQYGINAQNIIFEIKEKDIAKNLSLLEKFVFNLQRYGFKFGIDNFGSGYSVFRHIRNLQVDFVKLDGSFIKNLSTSKKDFIYIKSIASLSRELGFITIAKSVEDSSIFEKVKEAGIDYGQGYYIGVPREDIV